MLLKRFKKSFALFLSVLMIFSLLSVSAFAESDVVVSSDDLSILTNNETPLPDSNIPRYNISSSSALNITSGNDNIVVYNLGTEEIIVGNMGDNSAQGFFDANGNYIILLEDNAFFPYEVQFKWNGVTSVHWFDTPDSTVKIGNHTFSVHSEQYDPTLMSQIGVWIGDEYVAARPEPKIFTSMPGISVASLLPLEEVSGLTLDLSSYNWLQLMNVKVAPMFSLMNSSQSVGDSVRAAWTVIGENKYSVTEQNKGINFLNQGSNFKMELIVGSALQLDPNNIRYIVTVESNPNPYMIESLDVYSEVSDVPDTTGSNNAPGSNITTRSKVIADTDYKYVSSGVEKFDMKLSSNYLTSSAIYVGLTLNSGHEDYVTTVYAGSFQTAEAALSAANSDPKIVVTNRVINQTMSNIGAGFAIPINRNDISQDFTFVFKLGNEVIGIRSVNVNLSIKNNGLYYSNGLYEQTGTTRNRTSTYYDLTVNNYITTINYNLNSGYPANANYYLPLYYMQNNTVIGTNSSYVTKAVVGHFNTIDDASGATDIKDQLFPMLTLRLIQDILQITAEKDKSLPFSLRARYTNLSLK